MGLVAQVFASPRRSEESPALIAAWQDGRPQPGRGSQAYIRAYEGNDLFYSLSEIMATSAAEPRIIGRKYAPGKKDAAKARANYFRATGLPESMIGAALTAKNLSQDIADSPAARLANNPNPRTSKFDMWSAIVLDYVLAGNAYVWKSGPNHSPRNGAPPKELWRLRPDRMTVVPDRNNIVAGYEFRLGGEVFFLPDEDVIHFKKRSLSSDFYGQPITDALAGRIALDNAMRLFPTAFFNNAGVPSGVLSSKVKLSKESRDEIRDRWRGTTGGPAGWHELIVMDGTDATFTPTTATLGSRGLVLPELNAIGEARICAAFGVPPSIVGALVGLEKSSYANSRVDWRILWQVCLMPLYSYLDDQLSLYLLPDFGRTVDELIFDMSDVKALQEDVDMIMDRARRNVDAGLWTIEEGRLLTGVDPQPNAGEHILLPTRSTLVPTPIEDSYAEMPPPIVTPGVAALLLIQNVIRGALPEPAATLEPARLGRPPLERDAGARSLFDRGEQLRKDYPRMSEAQIADRLGIGESTWRRYRSTFGDDDV